MRTRFARTATSPALRERAMPSQFRRKTIAILRRGSTITCVRILYVVTEDWYFFSHRFDLACDMLAQGAEVYLASRFSYHRGALENAGIRTVAIPFERSLKHPLTDIRNVMRLRRAIAELRPDIVHLVALKPIVISGALVACYPRIAFVHAVTGMGYIFAQASPLRTILRRLLLGVLRHILGTPNSWVIVQNSDDAALLDDHGLGLAARRTLIRGAGVDVARFQPTVGTSRNIVVLVARMLHDKGIGEFVVAARCLKPDYPGVRFVLVGPLDPDNPAALSASAVQDFSADGAVEWWGQRDDVNAIYAQALIACLPSYREGLPKSLLEAAASGVPLVATDVPGCRDICRAGINGILVPKCDAVALAQALRKLLDDPALRQRYAEGGRSIVQGAYCREHVSAQTWALYQRMIEAH